MRVSVLINNYNYARYLPEAVGSVLAQSRVPDEIVLVDDGSTDDSLEGLARACDLSRVTVIRKPNGGQLSAFNAGFEAATGDVLFFLDSDDLYEPDYIAKALDFLATHPDCDFLMTGFRKFGAAEKLCQRHPTDLDLGYSVILALYGRRRLGGPTSTLCIRRRVLEPFMPLPLESDWRARADDCLAYGCSVAGAHKYFMAEPLVRYRIHDRNIFQAARREAADERRIQVGRRLRINRLLGHVAARVGYFLPTLILYVTKEYRSTPHGRLAKDHGHYLKAVWYSEKGLAWKLSTMVLLSLFRFGDRLRGAGPGS